MFEKWLAVILGTSRSPLTHASRSWGKPPDALYETLRERGLANAALSLLASPLLPKGEASAKGEDRAGSP
ncbi:hypothetical protein [Nostoc sp.]|uniref:hypothetical protein n=1 Tax=Nostoc sp. TaxID=1180 RepID=UPI002FF50507